MKPISIDKMSKKEKKEYYKQYRVTWGFSPVTRSPRDKTKYHRPASKAELASIARKDY